MCAVKTGVFERDSTQAVILVLETNSEVLIKSGRVAMVVNIPLYQVHITQEFAVTASA